MSATIGNLKEICTFLNADVYQRNFRPVELTEYVKCGDEIAKINWDKKDDLLTFYRRATFQVRICRNIFYESYKYKFNTYVVNIVQISVDIFIIIEFILSVTILIYI